MIANIKICPGQILICRDRADRDRTARVEAAPHAFGWNQPARNAEYEVVPTAADIAVPSLGVFTSDAGDRAQDAQVRNIIVWFLIHNYVKVFDAWSAPAVECARDMFTIVPETQQARMKFSVTALKSVFEKKMQGWKIDDHSFTLNCPDAPGDEKESNAMLSVTVRFQQADAIQAIQAMHNNRSKNMPGEMPTAASFVLSMSRFAFEIECAATTSHESIYERNKLYSSFHNRHKQ